MAARPSLDWKSAMTVLTSSLEPDSSLDPVIDDLLARASFIVPHKPFGCAAETAMPTSTTLSKTLVHSSGVKFCLFAMTAPKDLSSFSHAKGKIMYNRHICRVSVGVCGRQSCAGGQAHRPTD